MKVKSEFFFMSAYKSPDDWQKAVEEFATGIGSDNLISITQGDKMFVVWYWE